MVDLSGRCYLPHEDLLVELREAVVLEEERRLAEAIVVTATLQQVSQLVLAQLVSPILQRMLVIELLDLEPSRAAELSAEEVCRISGEVLQVALEELLGMADHRATRHRRGTTEGRDRLWS